MTPSEKRKATIQRREDEGRRLETVKSALDRFLAEHEVKIVAGPVNYGEDADVWLVSERDPNVEIELAED